jgi:Arc/MetJ-type ribon-helix-helix transcriptional regulator
VRRRNLWLTHRLQSAPEIEITTSRTAPTIMDVRLPADSRKQVEQELGSDRYRSPDELIERAVCNCSTSASVASDWMRSVESARQLTMLACMNECCSPARNEELAGRGSGCLRARQLLFVRYPPEARRTSTQMRSFGKQPHVGINVRVAKFSDRSSRRRIARPFWRSAD